MRIKRKHHPKIKKIKHDDLASLLERARNNSLTADDCDDIQNMAETIEFIIEKLNQKDVRLKQLLKQILGIKSEKTSNVLKNLESGKNDKRCQTS